jgi:cysteine desulfurase
MCCVGILQEVANIIGAEPKEIIFTSGATEANNIAIKGVARFYKAKKNHVITTQTVTCGMISYYDTLL